jgi:hypothetical protein
MFVDARVSGRSVPVTRQRRSSRGTFKSISFTASPHPFPKAMEEANKELLEAQGLEFVYESLIGERAPPLDYRK